MKLSLSILPDTLAVCRLDRDEQIPSWATKDDFFSITKTADELSIVCTENNVPSDVKAEKGWRAFKVDDPLDFSLTGILASLVNPLAKAKISIFAVSTYDTDYILVKEKDLNRAKEALSKFCDINGK